MTTKPVNEGITMGEYIRLHREAAKLSLREVARRIGVSHVFMGAIERGDRALPSARFQAVAKAVPGTTLEALTKIAGKQATRTIDWVVAVGGAIQIEPVKDGVIIRRDWNRYGWAYDRANGATIGEALAKLTMSQQGSM